jgi:hypothetical protein
LRNRAAADANSGCQLVLREPAHSAQLTQTGAEVLGAGRGFYG